MSVPKTWASPGASSTMGTPGSARSSGASFTASPLFHSWLCSSASSRWVLLTKMLFTQVCQTRKRSTTTPAVMKISPRTPIKEARRRGFALRLDRRPSSRTIGAILSAVSCSFPLSRSSLRAFALESLPWPVILQKSHRHVPLKTHPTRSGSSPSCSASC